MPPQASRTKHMVTRINGLENEVCCYDLERWTRINLEDLGTSMVEVKSPEHLVLLGFKGDGKLKELLWGDKEAPKDEVHFFLVCRTILGFPAVTQSTKGTAMRGKEEATCVPAGTPLLETARRLLIPVPGIEPEVRYTPCLLRQANQSSVSVNSCRSIGGWFCLSIWLLITGVSRSFVVQLN